MRLSARSLAPAFPSLPLLWPATASAHAIAERYDLPVPLGFYVFGAAAVVAVTFLITALFIYRAPGEARDRVLFYLPTASLQQRLVSVCTLALQVIGILALLAVIATGLWGNWHPARNLAPTLVWIMWWCALSVFVACVGNIWIALNPWRSLSLAASALHSPSLPAVPPRAYPERLAEWPAVVLLIIFVWIELIAPFSASPQALAILAIAYTALTLSGMALYGRDTWLKRGEVFSLVFSVLASFAPFGIARSSDPLRTDTNALVLRSWTASLFAKSAPHSMAMIALVLLLLSSVLFDGLLGTGLWRTLEPMLPSDRNGYIASSYGLLATWGVFLAAYLLTAAAMSKILGGSSTTLTVASQYLLTLVPIAVGYNIAHNYSYIALQTQTFIALLSDPFGFGWNLLGTTRWEPDLEAIDAREVWYVAVGAIIIGHVIAVYLAHIVALKTAPSHRLAILSLIPMTILMVAYTGASLSILAEPIVRFSMPDPSYS